jgi:hypothetical protein
LVSTQREHGRSPWWASGWHWNPERV